MLHRNTRKKAGENLGAYLSCDLYIRWAPSVPRPLVSYNWKTKRTVRLKKSIIREAFLRPKTNSKHTIVHSNLYRYLLMKKSLKISTIAKAPTSRMLFSCWRCHCKLKNSKYSNPNTANIG